MASVPQVRTRRRCTWQDRWELREAYAFCGSLAEAVRQVNKSHHDRHGNPKPSDWVDITYQAAMFAKKHDARLGPTEDWDRQAPNIRLQFIEQSEKRQGKRAIDLTDKLFERIEATVDNPAFQVRGSIAAEIHTSVKTARLLADKSTEITGIGDVATWWAGLSPQQQRDELSKLGVDVKQFDDLATDPVGSGDGGDSAEDEDPTD